ncbi:hypothetical protein ACXWR7_11625, partial [Streptococcus pyogenes]
AEHDPDSPATVAPGPPPLPFAPSFFSSLLLSSSPSFSSFLPPLPLSFLPPFFPPLLSLSLLLSSLPLFSSLFLSSFFFLFFSF